MVNDVWHPPIGADYKAIDIGPLSVDDAVWKNLLITDRFIGERMNSVLSVDEAAMMGLINLGVYDDDTNNGIWLRRSLGHASALAMRLWSVVLTERAKVYPCDPRFNVLLIVIV
jgi:hypothetical protein